jgi:hypothetical protein
MYAFNQLVDRLRGALANAIGDATVMDLIQMEMWELLGPQNLNILFRPDRLTHQAALSDVEISYQAAPGKGPFLTADKCAGDSDCVGTQFKFVVGQNIQPNFPIGFDLGLNGLPLKLEVDGRIMFSLSWQLHFGFGYHATDGFYLVANQSQPIVELRIDVTLPGFDAKGTLLILTAEAKDNGNTGIHLGCGLNPSKKITNGRISFTDIARKSIYDLVYTECRGDAVVDLGLQMTMAGWDGFPTVLGDLVLDWPFLPGSSPSGGEPTAWLKNVRLDIGSFFKKVINPVASKVMAIVGPMGEVVRSLKTPLPGVSTFAGQDVSLISLPETLLNGILGSGAGFSGHAEGVMAYVDEIERLINLLDKILTTIKYLDEHGGIVLIGDFKLIGDTRSALPPKRGVAQNRDFQTVGDAAALYSTVSKLDFVKTKGGFSFPLLDDPKLIMKLVLGQDIPLIQYMSPQLDVDMAFGFGLPVPGVIVAFSGWFKFHAGITLGYDTKGIMRALKTKDPLDALDGFYIDVSRPLLSIAGSIKVNVELNAVIFRAGVYGIRAHTHCYISFALIILLM